MAQKIARCSKLCEAAVTGRCVGGTNDKTTTAIANSHATSRQKPRTSRTFYLIQRADIALYLSVRDPAAWSFGTQIDCNTNNGIDTH